MQADPTRPLRNFGDYRPDAENWITLTTGDYYPDILQPACALYQPVLVTFDQLLRASESSARLFTAITGLREKWMREQLLRVFKKYVHPGLPVEMTKRIRQSETINARFSSEFRPVQEVQAAFHSRPMPDEALCALLWEYKDRGKIGYNLTARLFALLREQFPALTLAGPEGAGPDVRLGTVLEQYPRPERPVDFLLLDGGILLAIGFARYDSDRGGAQEDDRVGGYANAADEILTYFRQQANDRVKVLFVNDGPGLLLGSMWTDYARLEQRHPGRIMVLTLRMVPERLTDAWLRS